MSKKFLAGVFAVALFAVASVASAYDFGATTLRVGSRGEAVKNVQIVVGATPVDGIFGPMTKAKVMAWQAANGLTPVDGIFGSMSKAKANAGTVPVVGGTLCPNGMLLSNNCNAPTTGPTTLSGDMGDLKNIKKSNSGLESTVRENTTEKVLGIELESDLGSDLAINSFKLKVTSSGTGSTRIERYVEEVEIWQGNKKVGSADVSEFSRSGSVYTRNISLSNAVVKSDSKEKFFVAFKAKSVVDSADINKVLNVELETVRFTDAMGVVQTVNPSSTVDADFDFKGAAEDDGINLLSSQNNPSATNFKVKTNGVSDEYMLLAFRLKADSDSSDLNVLEIPIEAITGTAEADKIVSDIYLKVGSSTYSDYEYNSSTNKFVFEIEEGDFEIYEGETVEVKVYAKFLRAGLSSTYVAGDTIQLKVTGTNLVIENANGDAVDSPTNVITGNTHKLIVEGVDATFVSSSFTAEKTGTDVAQGTIAMKFKVSVLGDQDVVIKEDASNLVYAVTGATAKSDIVTSTEVTAKDGNLTIQSGETKELTLSVKFDTTNVFVRLAITGIDGTTVDLKTVAY